MNFALVIHGAPYAQQAPLTALGFARAALDAGHAIHRVFFYHEGVHNANELIVAPEEERDILGEWVALAEAHGIELAVCIAVSLKRGVIDAGEAARHERRHHDLHPAFTVAGLGQLIDAAMSADRLVTFPA